MQAFKQLTSKTVVLPKPHIDTDQIIPARFLKVTDKKGLGKAAFCDWRYLADGRDNPEFPLNDEAAKDATILVAGDNFGCGSSREHAPWALLDYGIRAVISTRIADIFRNNALKNGLLPVQVDERFHAYLLANPGTQLTIDLEKGEVTGECGQSYRFEVDPFAKYCLLRGLDQLDFLISCQPDITAYEEASP